MENRQPGVTTKAVCGHPGLLFVIEERFVYNLTEDLGLPANGVTDGSGLYGYLVCC